ncbi:MAG: hypothetical protein APF76_08650 [Desulfitibacter sp. BRH_c19]|nr:MAG: hypothetical protein APF76_08650 [Desulfitibacter sp. BRH_c19]
MKKDKIIKKRWKRVALLFAILFVFTSTTLASQAANANQKTLNAIFGLTKIIYNSSDLTAHAEPFLADGTTYIPLRKMGEVFNKNITWDDATKTVVVSDKPVPALENMQAQLNAKDNTIAMLEVRIAELEEYISKKEPDLDDLEDQLNDDYDEYEDIEFEISLSGDEDDIEVEIEVDLDDFYTEWNKLSNSDIEDYLQDICDDILDEFEDADITGSIIDTDEDEELISFEIDSRGNVETDYEADIDDLEDQLNDDYDEYEDIDFEVYLFGDEDDIEVEIEVDLYDFYTEWNRLSNSDIEDYLQDICDDILDEFENADIIGFIIDIDENENLVYFEIDSQGNVEIEYDAYLGSLEDLEDQLDDEYYDQLGDTQVYIELEGDEDDILFIVNIDLYDYDDEWDDLDEDDDIYPFMQNIYRDIEDEFEDAYIEGVIYDIDDGKDLYWF